VGIKGGVREGLWSREPSLCPLVKTAGWFLGGGAMVLEGVNFADALPLFMDRSLPGRHRTGC